jgi:hypothetical protein
MNITWSPFQSARVKQICGHMTWSEKTMAAVRGGAYGFWVAGTFAFPVASLVWYSLGLGPAPMPAIPVPIAAFLIVLHIVCLPIWWRSQRRFLCSTRWAREQDIQPDVLALFSSRELDSKVDDLPDYR